MKDLIQEGEGPQCNMSANVMARDITSMRNKRLILNEEKELPLSRQIITKCEHCSQCLNDLSLIHQWLSNFAIESKIQSLLVVVIGGSMTPRINPETLKSENVKFVYMDEEPGPIMSCEIGDSTDNDALKSFSKTSVRFFNIHI